ncbi:YhdP family protein [Methylobacter psychrophilus]|uniref:YhdP family protein n=1 Tax=Methylobacter psychrophilus TaxID=96941 RepID=UPI0021D4B0C7|nr:YhdP family protein [Methylobacter psychrophilus]
MIHHIKRATRHLVFWSLIALAVSLTTVRLLLLQIDDYKADLSTRVSELVGVPVTIGRLRANMRGYSPQLVLKDINIASAVAGEPSAIQLKEIRLGINLLDVLINRDRLSSTWVTLVGAKLTVKRKQDGSIAIVGLKASDEQPLWLLQGNKYEILQSQISWQDELGKNKLAIVGDVDFAIINNAQRHQMNILVKLPKKYGNELRVSMDLMGNVFKPLAIDGTIFIEGKNLHLAEWLTSDLPFSINIHSGTGNVKLWSKLAQSKLVSLTGNVQLQQLKLRKPDNQEFLIKQLNTLFYWQLNGSQWHLDAPDFLLETANKKWPATILGISGNGNLPHKIGLFVKQVDAQEISKILQFFAPLSDEQFKKLAQIQLQGSLEELSLFADLDEKHYAVNGEFTNISFPSLGAMPGMENLTGHLKGSDQLGRVTLATKDARLTAPGLFRETLTMTKLEGAISWQQTLDNWLISSPIIQLDAPHLNTKSKMNLTIPKTQGQKTFMDLQMAFASDDVSQVTQYLPVSTMGKSSVDWLDKAFISGRVPKGGMLFYGNLSDFPFIGGQGIFEALFDIDQLELNYNSEWPHLTDLGGEVLFLQGGLQVDLAKGLSDKVKINQARVTIPSLNDSEYLLVKGLLETDILEGLRFMQKTPLNSSVDKLLGSIEPQGSTQVTLDLKLPLTDSGIAKVNGSAQLSNAKLKVKALDLKVNQINGALKFNELGIYSDIIKATALNYPVQIAVKSSDVQTTVSVAGRVDVGNLRKQFKIPGWQIAEGATDYQLKLQLPYGETSPELLMLSELSGLSLDLPGALAKTREQQRSLALTFNLADQVLLPINVNYNNQLKAAIKFNIKQQAIESANILVGSGDISESQGSGIKLVINRERLDLQDWLGLASSLAYGKESEAITGAVNSLKEIKIQSEHGLWGKADLGLFDLVLKPEGNYWVGDSNSSIAKGRFKIPVNLKGADSINLDMEELELSVLKKIKSQESSAALAPSVPDFMPLLTITSQKVLWQSVDLGQLSVITERIANGIAFKRIELTGNDQKLVLSGDWKIKGKQSETRIQGKLNMPRVGQLLSKLGVTKNFRETTAIVDFTGMWNAAPYQFSLMALQGKIDVNLKGGRILGIEPGFGRVLGMLAMAQWIKRLQLDFSDVYEEGLAFNSINGHFDLLKGKAITDNLVIDAISAKITLTGETDFINKSLDQIVNVAPKSADAVPIAGTIMGKVADIIGRTLTGKDQDGFFFGSQYLVKGDWENAQIIPLHENDGLLQKTWNGLTSFPWQEPNTP